MTTAAERDIRQNIVKWTLNALHQAWLFDYDNSWRAWQQADKELRELIGKVSSTWFPTQDLSLLPEDFDHATLRVQLLNVSRRRGRDARTYLRQLAEVPPPRGKERWRIGLGWSAPPNSPQAQWQDVVYGLAAAPDWQLITTAWRSLTSEFLSMVRDVNSEDGEAPEVMTQPAHYAWLDRAARQPMLPNERLLVALRDLPEDGNRSLANVLLEQHAAWQKASLIPRSGCVQSLDYVIPTALAQIACVNQPLDEGALRRARSLRITYPPGIFRADSPSWSGGEGDVSFLREGITLKEPKDASARPAVRAAHGEQLRLPGIAEPVLVLLDIDLTHPDMAFLGLKGSRLRICDAADHSPSPCFTRVTTDGSVELLGDWRPPAPRDWYDVGKEFVADRPLLSPFEGMRSAGYLGTKTRIGGAPNWEQYPEVPESPVSGKPMTFIAQFPHPLGGTAYVFLDYTNLIATVVTQWD